jgi:glucose-6-phosphate 1-dehydrogenase
MFQAGSGVGGQGLDHLTFDLADASKRSLSFYGKRPGPGMRLDKLSLQFPMHDTGLLGEVLEAQERSILEAMRRDRKLFTTAEGIEQLWQVSARRLPVERAWRAHNPLGRGGGSANTNENAHLAVGVSRGRPLRFWRSGRDPNRPVPAVRSGPRYLPSTGAMTPPRVVLLATLVPAVL